jgi:tetratricopeptide (TPR) repeat protein
MHRPPHTLRVHAHARAQLVAVSALGALQLLARLWDRGGGLPRTMIPKLNSQVAPPSPRMFAVVCVQPYALALSQGHVAARVASTRIAAAPRLSEDLAVRVLDALLDEEEKPFIVWNEESQRPLRINLDLLNHRARVLQRRNDVEGALETFEYCCSIDPNDGRAWLARARIKEREGLPEEAQALLKEALRWSPDSAHLLQAYGALQERRGRCDEALDLYTAAVRASPSHAPAWVACGLLLERRRQHEAAATCLLTASGVAPRSVRALGGPTAPMCDCRVRRPLRDALSVAARPMI